MSTLNGWHPGESRIQQKLGFTDKVAAKYTAIRGFLSPEDGQFYQTCLPFIPVVTLDDLGRPWGSILAGQNGEKGFMRSLLDTQLEMKVEVWDGDPFGENILQFYEEKAILIAGIGIEFSTRLRHKFAGIISKLHRAGSIVEIRLLVNEAIRFVVCSNRSYPELRKKCSHCPKYITIRDVEPQTDRQPKVVHKYLSLSREDRLPDDVIQFVRSCDTVFLGTSYVAQPEDAEIYPSHVGINHRGGLAGFVRVRNDARTVVLPDYSGEC